MALRWLRGGRLYSGGGTYNSGIAGIFTLRLYNFMRRILGYTHVDEVCAGGRSFASCYDDSGTDGVFTGSSRVFSAASISLTTADRFKHLVIVDETHPENCGIYPILDPLTSSTALIDFYCGDISYPSAATNFSWWLVDDTDAPNTDGDYAVLRSPAGPEFKLRVSDSNYFDAQDWDWQWWYLAGAAVTVAVEANSWDATAHAWKAGAPVLTRQVCGPAYDSYNDDTKLPRHCMLMAGDTEGEFFWNANCDSPTGTGAIESCWMFSKLNMVEQDHSAREQFYFGGIQGTQYTDYIHSRYVEDPGVVEAGIADGQVWLDSAAAPIRAMMMGYNDVLGQFGYSTSMDAGNARTKNKVSVPIVISVDDGSAYWAPWGSVPTTRMRILQGLPPDLLGEFKLGRTVGGWTWDFRDGLSLPAPRFPLHSRVW